jgi:hypothetical protein
MLTFIIVCFAVFILYNFFSDREKELENVDSHGGMKKKYSKLLSRLSINSGEITRLTRDNICFSVRTKYYLHQFSVLQTFGKVSITWTAKSAISNANEQWEFPDHQDQDEMANQIEQKMQYRLTSF